MAGHSAAAELPWRKLVDDAATQVPVSDELPEMAVVAELKRVGHWQTASAGGQWVAYSNHPPCGTPSGVQRVLAAPEGGGVCALRSLCGSNHRRLGADRCGVPLLAMDAEG